MTTPTRKGASNTNPFNGVNTPIPIQNGMVGNCDAFYNVKSGDVCSNIAASYGISLSQFYAWNPYVGTSCTDMWPGYYVCVSTFEVSPVATPTPFQAGMVANCRKFYLVRPGDGCYNIATAYGISLTELYDWNPAVRTDCSVLLANYFVCVGL
jgi:LysM repeat protein